MSKAFSTPMDFYNLLKKLDEEEKKNVIDIMVYLSENSIELTHENIILYLKPNIFSKLKKDLKGIKKVRKNINEAIISFYS